MELPPAVAEALARVPLWQLGLVVSVVLTAALLVGRVLLNTLLNGKRPPIMEGYPFVGGLIKFAQVRALAPAPWCVMVVGGQWQGGGDARCAVAGQWRRGWAAGQAG